MEQIKIIYRQDKAREITIFIGKKYAMEKVKIPDNLHIASQSFLAYDWFLKWQQYVEQQESKQTIAFLLDQILIFTNFYNFVAKQKTNDMICFQQNNNENFAN